MTVLPGSALTAEVDGPVDAVDAVVMLHVLTHFSPADRQNLWRRWAPLLRPGGLVVADVQAPIPVPSTVMPGRALGRRRYDTIAEAVVDGNGLAWTMTYRMYEGDRLVSEESASFPSFIASDDVLHAELREAGCEPVAEVPPGLLAWRRR